METENKNKYLSIIIVQYGSSTPLIQCLKSLQKTNIPVTTEVIVVRNDNVNDNSFISDIFQAEKIDLKVIVNSENSGFGKACNQAAELAMGEFILFLNPDTIVSDRTLPELLAFHGTKEDCGIVAPMILDPDGSIQQSARTFPSLRTAFFGRTSLLTRLFPSNPFTVAEFSARESRENTEYYEEVDWVSGAAMLIRKPLFQEIGGFDEAFFMYWEDADICFRLSQRDLKVYYLKNCTIEHAAGSCSKSNRSKTIIEFHKSVLHILL